MPSKFSRPHFLGFFQSKFGILGAGLLLFNVLALYGIFFFFHTSSLDYFVQKYPLLDPMRHFMEEKHIITTLQPIREKFREIIDQNGPDSISLYFEYLNTGANISINPDLRILPASLIKVPLAMAVMKKVERGEWLLTNELVMMKEDRDTNWGDVHKRPLGSTITIQELIEEMLLNSDNTAYRILYRNMSFDDLQDVLINLGLEDLFNEEGKMSSKEYTRLIRALYAATYLDEEYSQLLLDTLSRTSYDAYLGQGIPDTVKFAHKIGENVDDKVISDSGVVYVENRPYMISVMINYEKMGHEKALQVLKQISEIGYSYISTAQHEKD